MMENLSIGLIAGAVMFVMYLSNSAKKKERMEKEKQDEFSMRLENLNKIIETEVTINTELLEKVEEVEKSDEVLESVEKFKAKREKKKD